MKLAEATRYARSMVRISNEKWVVLKTPAAAPNAEQFIACREGEMREYLARGYVRAER